MNAKFGHTTSDLFGIAEVSKREPVNPGDDLCLNQAILQPSLPPLEKARLPNFKH